MKTNEQPDTDVSDPAACQALWAAALKSLLSDARLFSRGRADKDGDRAAAYFDVLSNGPMLRHCCRWLETNPEWLSEQFAKRVGRWH